MAPDPQPQGKLPVAPNMSQILNRISMGLANHERILSTLKRPAASPSNITQARSSSTTGFSSLSSTPIPLPTTFSTTGIAAQRTKKDDEAAFERERNLPPNAGIGFVEEKKSVEKGQEDKMLRGRLLGKRGRENGKDAGRGKREKEEESEEEEGRSGLGKKKRRRRVVAPEEDAGMGRDTREVADSEGVVVGMEKDKVVPEGVEGAEESTVGEVVRGEECQQHDVLEKKGDVVGGNDEEANNNGVAEASSATDFAELAAEKKRKRKAAKRKRSKANKAAQESAETI